MGRWQERIDSDEATWGDPMSPLRWTTKSTRSLAAELARQAVISVDTKNKDRGPGLEGRAGRPGAGDRAGGHRLPLPVRHVEVA